MNKKELNALREQVETLEGDVALLQGIVGTLRKEIQGVKVQMIGRQIEVPRPEYPKGGVCAESTNVGRVLNREWLEEITVIDPAVLLLLRDVRNERKAKKEEAESAPLDLTKLLKIGDGVAVFKTFDGAKSLGTFREAEVVKLDATLGLIIVQTPKKELLIFDKEGHTDEEGYKSMHPIVKKGEGLEAADGFYVDPNTFKNRSWSAWAKKKGRT
jgi:hypothetical protein